MIVTEEFNNETMRMNAAPMICDKNKLLKLIFFLRVNPVMLF